MGRQTGKCSISPSSLHALLAPWCGRFPAPRGAGPTAPPGLYRHQPRPPQARSGYTLTTFFFLPLSANASRSHCDPFHRTRAGPPQRSLCYHYPSASLHRVKPGLHMFGAVLHPLPPAVQLDLPAMPISSALLRYPLFFCCISLSYWHEKLLTAALTSACHKPLTFFFVGLMSQVRGNLPDKFLPFESWCVFLPLCPYPHISFRAVVLRRPRFETGIFSDSRSSVCWARFSPL